MWIGAEQVIGDGKGCCVCVFACVGRVRGSRSVECNVKVKVGLGSWRG